MQLVVVVVVVAVVVTMPTVVVATIILLPNTLNFDIIKIIIQNTAVTTTKICSNRLRRRVIQ